jgi:uncharacterized protein (DUF885 family)
LLSPPPRRRQPRRRSPITEAEAAQLQANVKALLADKVLGARFTLAQMLAAAGRIDDALAELKSVRPFLAVAFGTDSTQVRNLDKHIDRLGSIKEHSLSRRDDELGR